MDSSHNLPVRFEKEVHLLDYLSVVQRRWRIILLITLIIVAVVTINTLRQVHVYQASVVLRVGMKPEASSEILQTPRENFFSIDSEIQLLLSNEIAEKAAVLLAGRWRPEERMHGTDVLVQDLTVPSDISRLQLVLTSNYEFRLLTADGRLMAEGRSGEPFSGSQATGIISIDSGRAGQNFTLSRPTLGEARSMTFSARNAGEFKQGSSLLQLTVNSVDPAEARDAANAIADAYVENNRTSRVNEASLMLGFIDEQLKSVGTQLDLSEQALQSFKIRTGLERLSTEGAKVVESAVELEKQRSDLQLRRQRLSAYLAELRRGTTDYSAIQDLPGMSDFIRQQLELRSNRNALLRKFTPEHPSIVEIDEQLKQSGENIAEMTRSALRGIDLQIVEIGQQLGRSSQRLAQVPEDELELVRLTRANQVNAELYSYLLQRQQETRIRQASASGNVEIVNRAVLPSLPIYPNKRKSLAFGLALGVMVGLGLAFFLDYLDRTIKDEDDIQSHLDLPVIGTIPRIPPGGNGKGSGRLIVHLAPHTAANEAFLALRTNLLFLTTNQKHKTLMVTSCLPAEGKSTIAANLAVAFAQTGAKTLLIDCDLRRPSQHRLLRQPEAPGLTDILHGNQGGSIRRIVRLNLDFIAAGAEPENPTQLLGSEGMRNFLSKAHARYDYIILDVPPLLPVTDALILASLVDLNILVLESCRIPLRLATRALNSLQGHNAAPAGVVLNDKTGKGAKYYGAYSYYEGKYYQGYYRRNEPVGASPRWKVALSRFWNFING